MPYYIHTLNIPADGEVLHESYLQGMTVAEYSPLYYSRKDVYEFATVASANWAVPVKVTLVIDDSERRMLSRRASGLARLYPLPEAWPTVPEHFAYAATTAPGKVAYIANDEALAAVPEGSDTSANKHTVVSAGTYLKRFWPMLADDAVAELAGLLVSQKLELALATTPEDIERVYRAKGATDKRPAFVNSCMGPDSHDGSVSHSYRHRAIWTDHPCRVYGNSDLAVAYFGDMDNVRGRCVVWPGKKRYSRLYAGDTTLLRTLLESAGYAEGSLSGARIRRIPHSSGNGYLMPYVDSVSVCDEDGDYWILGQGDTDCRITNGVAEGEDSRCECENCGDSFAEHDSSTYCVNCYDDLWYCESCNEASFDSEGMNSTDYGIFCNDCYASRECVMCNHDFSEYEYSRVTRQYRQNNGMASADICENCAVQCVTCKLWIAADDSHETDDSSDTYCRTCFDELPKPEETDNTDAI